MLEAPVLIILAGGKSSRMGCPKGLLDFNNNPWILEQISHFKHVIKPKVYIGLGYDNDLYFRKIEWFKKAVNNFYFFDGVEVRVVVNPFPEKGSFSTLQAVLKEVEKTKDVLVLPIDVPLLNTKELQELIAVENLVSIPTSNDRNGHPVKLAPPFWNKLIALDVTFNEARLDYQIKSIDTSNITYLSVLDTTIYQNINHREDWLLYKKSFTEK